jgi:hypothetical protein
MPYSQLHETFSGLLQSHIFLCLWLPAFNLDGPSMSPRTYLRVLVAGSYFAKALLCILI